MNKNAFRWKTISLVMTLLLVGFAIGLAGPRLLARAFRHGLEWTLRRQLARAQHLQVQIGPVSPHDLLGGVFHDVHIIGQEFTTFDGLRYRRLVFTSSRLQVETIPLLLKKELVWREMAEAELLVEVDEAAINSWLKLRYPEWNPEVHLVPGNLQVSGKYDFGFGKVPFTAKGIFQIADRQNLVFLSEQIEIGGLSLPHSWLEKIKTSVGGLEIQLEIPFPLSLDNFQIQQGYLRAQWREIL